MTDWNLALLLVYFSPDAVFSRPDVDLFSCAGYCGPGLPVLAGTAPCQPLLLRDGGRHRHLHPRRVHISHSGPLKGKALFSKAQAARLWLGSRVQRF